MKIKTVGTVSFAKTIADLEVGETCWVSPWAADFDETGVAVSLDTTFYAATGYGGTNTMAVTKIEEDEYKVDVRRVPPQSMSVALIRGGGE